MTDNYTIAESFTLPSGGAIYEYEVNPEITLRSMTTNEEMRRLAVTDNSLKSMCDIIDACMVGENIEISSYDMCLGDYLFLLYKLRTVTYGSDYKMSAVCPYCGYVEDVEINLDNLQIKDYSDLISEYKDVTLPQTEKVVTLRMQTPRILDQISNKVKEEKRRGKNKDIKEDLNLLYSLYYTIELIDGKKPNPLDLEKWIRKLPLRDTNILRNGIERLNNLVGVELTTDTECDLCHSEYSFPFRITNEFFSPSIDD